MSTRRRLGAVGMLAATLGLGASAAALERTSVRIDLADRKVWDAAASCTVTYANTCTGWVGVWTEWDPFEIFGVVFEPCCEGGHLVSTQALFWTGAPPGWGYTGTIAVSDVNGNCLGTRYDGHVLLPSGAPEIDTWDDIPAGPVALTWTNGPREAPPSYGLGFTIATDHPSAGPTGPQACGLCYPTTRVTHTFRFGTPTAPLCPGSPLNDGVCNAEAYSWSAGFACPVVSAEKRSWGSLKNLYR